MHSVDLALKIATQAHEGQTDLDGEPYILHPLAVGLMGRTDEERCAGFLHDVIEDTDWTAERLLEAGIHESVVGALRLLTHDKSQTYDDYIQNIIDSHNPIALQVKRNDLTHNYERGKAYPTLQLKHGRALEKISKVVDLMNRTSLYSPYSTIEQGHDITIFAAGCFWGVQSYMERHPGVVRTFVGYTGGNEDNPTYEDVRTHRTHHLEAVLVEFDPKLTNFDSLCRLFFEIHDPAQTDGQGPDKGEQYRSAIFARNQEQAATSQHLIDMLRSLGHEVNTELLPAGPFWIAEAYHQNYYDNTGGSPYCHVRVRKFPK